METVELKYKTYPAYKDSGVEWLGEIPKGWELLRIKYVFKEINERSFDGSGDLVSVSQYTGVTKKSEKIDKGDLLTNAYTLDGYKIDKEGVLVSNIMLAWNGSLGFSPFNGITSPAYSVYRLKQGFEKQYFHYLLRTDLYKAEFKRESTGIIESRLRLYTDDFFRIWSFLPPTEEQTAIAAFLDNKTAKIEKAIAQKEKLIALLKERKQILIQNAVTGKVVWNEKENAWTVPAEVKDSGVEWIGEVPEWWEVKKVRFLFKFGKGLNITKENIQDEGIPCVSYGEIHSKYGFEVNPSKQELKCVDKEYLKKNKNAVLNYGDFVFADTSEDIEGSGNFTYLNSKETVFAGYHTVIARQKESHNPRFLAYVFNSISYRNQFRRKVKGVKVYSITNYILKNTVVWLPSKKEQKIIIEYCDNVSIKFDKSITLQQTQIEKLKEYKATLIDSAVTGKIKVS